MIGTQIKQPVESEAIVHVTYSVFDTYVRHFCVSVFQSNLFILALKSPI